MAKRQEIKEVTKEYYERKQKEQTKTFFQFHIVDGKYYMIATKNVWAMYG